MDAKVIFLAYANSQKIPLAALKKEDDRVFSTLVHRTMKGHFIIHRESYATLENINSYLEKYADNLVLFHYSGHANPNSILLDDTEANGIGIAHQLQSSARKGVLKLVILNGCSTAGQVEKLLKYGVPAVVATNAPVNDNSATEFAVRFFQNLSEKEMSIKNAFFDALGPAQAASVRSLEIDGKKTRGLDFLKEQINDTPLWELFTIDDSYVDINPLPTFTTSTHHSFTPNSLLNETLFRALHRKDNKEIKKLMEREQSGEYIELAEKQTAIINVLPYPIAIHLQKLLCPIDQENDGYDKMSLKRIEQIAEVYHTTVELIGFVMLSQLWELKLSKAFSSLPPQLIAILNNYFYLSPLERSVFDYLSFIRSIRDFLDELNQGEGIIYFIEELSELRFLAKEGHSFASACNYLYDLRIRMVNNKIKIEDIPYICEKSEENLCNFFYELGFLYRYNLTSIQNIDIKKYRHNLKAEFKHYIVKLMRAVGKAEHNYYMRGSNLDNRGVVLLKGDVQVINSQKKLFSADNLQFLNLSPFVIDRNAFEENSDLTNLMFFEQYGKLNDEYCFKNVKKPGNTKERMKVLITEEKYEPIWLQFEAFRSMILSESA